MSKKKKKLKSVLKLFAGKKSSVKVVEPTDELSKKKTVFSRCDGSIPKPKTKREKAIYKRQQEFDVLNRTREERALKILGAIPTLLRSLHREPKSN